MTNYESIKVNGIKKTDFGENSNSRMPVHYTSPAFIIKS